VNCKEMRGKRKKMKPVVFCLFAFVYESRGIFVHSISDVAVIKWGERRNFKRLNITRLICKNYRLHEGRNTY